MRGNSRGTVLLSAGLMYSGSSQYLKPACDGSLSWILRMHPRPKAGSISTARCLGADNVLPSLFPFSFLAHSFHSSECDAQGCDTQQ